MPWTVDNPPLPAQHWTEAEKEKCVAAANAALNAGQSEQDAVFACIGAAGKGQKDMESEAKMVVRYTQEEAQFQEISADLLKSACKTCRFFAGAERMCLIVENYPLEISEISLCAEYTARPAVGEPEPMPVTVVEGERAATEAEPVIEAEPEPVLEYGFIAPDSNRKGFLQSVKDKFTAGLKAGQTIVRDDQGRRHMVIVTSNSYQDREHETITSKALQRYVDSCWLADDYFRSDNVHQVWHCDQLTVGDIVWADMKGPFLVELSKERSDVVSKAAWDYWESAEGRQGLGASHRFLYRYDDKDAEGTLHLISKFETSTLPRQAAANLLTFSGVIPMSKEHDVYLDKMFGIDGVADMLNLEDGLTKLAEKLTEKGIQAKAVDEPTPEQAVQKAEDKFGALLSTLIESQAELLGQFTALQQNQQQAAEKTHTELKALAADNKALQEAMQQAPRASEHPDTKITDEKAKQDLQERAVAYDPFWGDMNVPKGS